MFQKVRRYWQGRVTVMVQGDNLPAFLSEALRDGLTFYHAKAKEGVFTGEMAVDDFPRLRRAARMAGVRIKVRKRYGFPFVVGRWQRRKGLLIGGFLIVFAFVTLSQTVLSVSVEGNERLAAEKILAAGEQYGLKKGEWKGGLDLERISEQLQEEFPDIAWLTMEERGTNIHIRLVEKVQPQEVTYAGDLVSAKTGYVDEIMVIKGIAQVREGQLVQEGQVLIKAVGGMKNYVFDMTGQESEVGEEEIPAAQGFVRGRVWYSAVGTAPLEDSVIEKTGQITAGWGIKIKGKAIMITNPESPYQNFSEETIPYVLPGWRNWRLPVEFVKKQYEEEQRVYTTRTLEEARKTAEALAREEAYEKIPREATIISEKTVVLAPGEGAQRIRVEVEAREELARYLP